MSENTAPASAISPVAAPPVAAQPTAALPVTAIPSQTPADDPSLPMPTAVEALTPKPGEKAQATLEKLRAQNAKRREEGEARARAEHTAQRALVERQQAEQRAVEAEKRVSEFEQRWNKVKDDPFAILKESGLEPKDVLQRAKDDSDPVKQAEKRAAAAEARVAEIERKLAERDAATERSAREEAERVATDRAEKGFVTAAGDESRYPHLASIAKHRPGAILAEARSIIAQVEARARAAGQPPPMIPDHEILAYLNSEWSKISTASSSAKTAPASVSTSAPASTLSSTAPAGSSTTLTNSDATEPGSLPKDLHKLSPREENRVLAQRYKRLVEQGRT